MRLNKPWPQNPSSKGLLKLFPKSWTCCRAAFELSMWKTGQSKNTIRTQFCAFPPADQAFLTKTLQQKCHQTNCFAGRCLQDMASPLLDVGPWDHCQRATGSTSLSWDSILDKWFQQSHSQMDISPSSLLDCSKKLEALRQPMRCFPSREQQGTGAVHPEGELGTCCPKVQELESLSKVQCFQEWGLKSCFWQGREQVKARQRYCWVWGPQVGCLSSPIASSLWIDPHLTGRDPTVLCT